MIRPGERGRWSPSLSIKGGKIPLRHGGYILLEVILALTLLGIGVLCAGRAFSTSFQAKRWSNELMVARELAQEKMALLVPMGEVERGAFKGDFGPQYPTYFWKMDISEIEESDLSSDVKVDKSFYKILLTVSWESSGEKSSYQLATLLPGKEGGEGE